MWYSPQKEFSKRYKFILHQGDVLKLRFKALEAAGSCLLGGKPKPEVSELVLMSEDGAEIYKRINVQESEKEINIEKTGVFVLKVTNKSPNKVKFSLQIYRWNPDPSLLQKSAIYREKEVCDTTWDTVFVNDTLGLERVDTTIEVVMEEIVHVSSAGKMMLTIGHRECRKFVQIRVPSVSWTKGFEPKVTFYAAHQESDRWLADAMGGILAVASRIPIDFLSKIPKGRTFRAGLCYRGQCEEGWCFVSEPEEVKVFQQAFRYSDLPSKTMYIYLDNCFSSWTDKDIVVRLYLTTYRPIYKIQKRMKVVRRVKCRRIPATEN